jgi:hypothetical protein
MNLPDIKNIFEIVYRYKDREFYLEGKEVREFLVWVGGCHILAVTHGMTFKPLNWKVRKIKEEKLCKKQ